MGLFDAIGRWLGGGQEPAAPRAARTDPIAPPAGPQPAFPYPLVTVHGDDALATWTRLRAAGEGYPVILGADDDIPFHRDAITDMEPRTPPEILAAAAPLSFPDGLRAMRDEEDRSSRAYLRTQGRSVEEDAEADPAIGDWPDHVQTNALTVHAHYTGRVYDRVHIAVLPCTTGWEAIAHLRFGNWNANPAAEHHVAALKSWHERYGAELVGCSHDVINLHVTRRPATREEALALAREQYLYCNDIIDQGAETLSNLAAVLMASDWWFFWWD